MAPTPRAMIPERIGLGETGADGAAASCTTLKPPFCMASRTCRLAYLSRRV